MLSGRGGRAVLVAVLAVLVVATSVEGVLYSSFYAPLYDPRVLGYRVEASFRPERGRAARPSYQRRYGYRGERLVDMLGKGGPFYQAGGETNNMYGDVNVYYTYS